jgi:hypothetical protein
MTCAAYTASHDAVEPRRYYAHTRAGRVMTVLCSGCAAVSEAMGAGWQLDRRSDPQRRDRGRLRRFFRFMTRTTCEAGIEAAPSALSRLRRSPDVPSRATRAGA